MALLDAARPFLTLDDLLTAAQASLDDVLGVVTQLVSLRSRDVVVVCGSAQEGLATSRSDIDVIVLTDSGEILEVIGSGRLESCRGLRLDIRAFDRNAFEALARQVGAWRDGGGAVGGVGRFTDADRKLLFRVVGGAPLWNAGQIAAWAAMVDLEALRRIKIARAVWLGQAGQVDLAGFAEDRDWPSLVYSARDLVGHVFDAILAIHGEANPSTKWRPRLLSRLPSNWFDPFPGPRPGLDAVEVYGAFQQVPSTARPAACLDYARRVAVLARRVIPVAEAAPRPEPAGASGTWRKAGRVGALACLDLDVSLRWVDGGFALFRAHAGGATARLDWPAFEVLSYFDGVSTVSDIPSAEQAFVEEIMALVRLADFARTWTPA